MIGKLPPRHGVATVELAATNSVMAGVEPDAFLLVIAAVEDLVRVMAGDALRPMIADVLARRLRGATDLQRIHPRVG